MAIIYRVGGMSCEGCANSVTQAIKAVAPEAMVAVSLAGKQVIVDGLDDDRAVEKAVGDAGFQFEGRE